MSSISGNTIFVVVALVLATMVFMNTLKLNKQGVVEEEMLKYRTEELAMDIEMISDFQNTGFMQYEFPVNYTIGFAQNGPSYTVDSAYPSVLTLAYNQKSYTTGVGVELQSYDSFNDSMICIKQKYPNSDIRRLSMTNEDFIRKYLIEKVRSACNTGGLRNYPSEGEYSFNLNGVDEIRTKWHDTIGSNYVNIKLKYGDGSTDSYKIDSNGWLADWACGGDPGAGMYQFNVSSQSGTNGPIDLDSDKVTRWRVMEEEDNKYVNIQIRQLDPGDIPGDKLVNITRGTCR